MDSRTAPRFSSPDTRLKRWHAHLAAAAFFGACLGAAGLASYGHGREQAAQRQAMTLAHAANVRARIESQLNSLLFLNSGLSSYLVVRSRSMADDEIHEILKTMHGGNPLVRNFGIALGDELRYVYPIKGNETAVGLHYREHPAQWRVIEQAIQARKPVLDGPLALVQGGQGLIYRTPIYVDGAYWGLLSTVIDPDAVFRAALAGLQGGQVEFAVRKGGDGGAALWGDMAVFDRPEAVLQRIDVAGSAWVLAARPADDGPPMRFALLAWLLALSAGGLGGWAIESIVVNRIRLAELALYDRLTGLPNRHLMDEHARRAFSRQDRNPGQRCSLMFIDLDGFKAINDVYGHRAGDATLRMAAGRAAAVLRAGDMVARWGGDEFVVLLEGVPPEGVELLRQRLRSALEAPFEHEGCGLRVGASIGVAHYPADGRSLDELARLADHLMYLEKSVRKRAA